MESNSNYTNASEKRIKSYAKKEQIIKALPEIGIVLFGVMVMVGLILWVVYFRFKSNIRMDYYTFSRPLTYAMLVGIVLLIFVLMRCAKLLSIIANNQIELMDSLSGTKEETNHISQPAVNTTTNADKVVRLMELREADLISQEEFEEQMSKI